MSKILITGLSGLLGNNLALAYGHRNKVLGIYNAHKVEINGIDAIRLDLSGSTSSFSAINEFCPDLVIHCAALSEVDRCEEDKDLAYKLNVEVTKNITKYSERTKSYLVYISTDCVYDGVKGNFKEEEAAPVNYYGETKLLGEEAALEYGNTLVIRTNFFGKNIQKKLSLAEWILHSLKNREPINGFSDAIFSTIYTFLFASVLKQAFVKGLKGVYNLASSDHMSKYDFAVSIADIFKLDKDLIKKTSVENFGFRAKRGKDMSLDIGRISKDLNIKLPSIKDSIVKFHRDCINDFRNIPGEAL